MTLFLTGAGGYLGTVLVRQLLRETSYSLIVYDRFSWGTQPLAAVVGPEHAKRVIVAKGDIRDLAHLRTMMTSADAIIHLAGIVGYPACDADPDDAETTNVLGTQYVAGLAQGRPLLFMSTGSTYGKVKGIADETHPISPLTRYGRTKAEGEALVLAAGGCCLRFATLFGLSPRMRWDLLPNDFVYRGVKEGHLRVYEGWARRTFLHVEDAASAIAMFVARTRVAPQYDAGRIFNIGADSLNGTKAQIAQEARALTGCTLAKAAGHDRDERDYSVSYQKLAASGWRPKVTLHAGMQQVAEFAEAWI